ncbi:hypothetical protein PABY_17180 [Pyrodictium abyssi]|uniref:Uncharacterized protein n=1 Tax=Pyrodictium abyssi TaxID=54256 RepID=A0ABM8IX79_9CREN|nr:hypothetical protein PABY_17180 [Pyrodictium abyssi]
MHKEQRHMYSITDRVVETPPGHLNTHKHRKSVIKCEAPPLYSFIMCTRNAKRPRENIHIAHFPDLYPSPRSLSSQELYVMVPIHYKYTASRNAHKPAKRADNSRRPSHTVHKSRASNTIIRGLRVVHDTG